MSRVPTSSHFSHGPAESGAESRRGPSLLGARWRKRRGGLGPGALEPWGRVLGPVPLPPAGAPAGAPAPPKESVLGAPPAHTHSPYGSFGAAVAIAGSRGCDRGQATCTKIFPENVPRDSERQVGRAGGAVTGRPEAVQVANAQSSPSALDLADERRK